jgi:hypothetical protein
VTRAITAADGPRYIACLTTALTTPLGQLTVDDSNASASTSASIPSPSAQFMKQCQCSYRCGRMPSQTSPCWKKRAAVFKGCVPLLYPLSISLTDFSVIILDRVDDKLGHVF